MNIDQKIDGLENQLEESKKKIENLSSMVQNFANNNASNPGNNVYGEEALKKLEAKLNILAKSSSPEYLDMRLSSLKEDIEKRQNVLNSKTLTLENVAGQIAALLERQTKITHPNHQELIIKSIEIIKTEIENLSKGLEYLADKETIEKLKSSTDLVDLNVNAVVSALSILDKKIKVIDETLKGLASLNDVKERMDLTDKKILEIQDSIDSSDSKLRDKFNAILQILEVSSTSNDIEELKFDIDNMSTKFSDLQQHIEALNKNDNNTGINSDDVEAIRKETECLKDSFNDYINSSVPMLQEKISKTLDILYTKSEAKDIDELKNEVEFLKSSIQDNLSRYESLISDLNLGSQTEEIKNMLKELFLKDDTGPVITILEALHEKFDRLDEISRDIFSNRMAKIKEEICLSQDKLNITVTNAVRSLTDEMTQLNERVLDIKESLNFQVDNEINHKEELAVIVERFNDIWTSAGLTIDKLGDQVSLTEESTNHLKNTVQSFFETSEDTNLIITNLLKKAADIDSNLNKIGDDINIQIENLTGNFDVESQKIQNTLNINNEKFTENFRSNIQEFKDKIAAIVEGDFNFIRADIIEFKDKQEKLLAENNNSQKSIQNSLSNLHFTVIDSKDMVLNRINEVAKDIDKLNNSTTDNLFISEVIKESIIQLAGWVDGADKLLNETNNCIRNIQKGEDTEKILAELTEIKKDISKNPFGSALAAIETKLAEELLNARNEIKTSIKNVKKRQESDFENINNSISGISKELLNISQYFPVFENKIKQDFKVLDQTISEKTGSLRTDTLITQLDSNLSKFKQDVNAEFKRVNGGEFRKIIDRFDSLNSSLENLEEKIRLIESRQANSNDNQIINAEFRKINDRINNLNSSFSSLEEKINLIEAGQVATDDNQQGIKQLLNSVLNKLSSLSDNNDANKGNMLLLKKITMMERRMTDFEANMKKVVDFIETE